MDGNGIQKEKINFQTNNLEKKVEEKWGKRLFLNKIFEKPLWALQDLNL